MEEMKTQLDSLEHAFWDLVDVLADNLPEDDPGETDPETIQYITDCQNRYEEDMKEFAAAIKAARKQVAGEKA